MTVLPCYEISDKNAVKLHVLAEDETRMKLDAGIVIPSVSATVSLPAIAASYTRNSLAPGVPAVVSIPTRTVTALEDWFVITSEEITASVKAGVLYKVANVLVPAVPCTCEYLYAVVILCSHQKENVL
jgi:hypothetical protein